MATTTMTYEEAFAPGVPESKRYRKGPPPAVGWWPCKAKRYPGASRGEVFCMRWWNGDSWSVYCTQADAEDRRLDRDAATATAYEIRWAHPWWPKDVAA